MIPLRDERRLWGVPAATLALIAACLLGAVLQLRAGDADRAGAVLRYGLVPARQREALEAVRASLPGVHLREIAELALPFLTFSFLHAGVLHLAGNLWFLWVFGRSVESRSGALLFLVFYLACGAAAGIVHAVTALGQEEAREILPGIRIVLAGGEAPAIGASGAVAGVLGAYLVLFQRGRVLTFFPPFFVFRVPGVLFLAVWFLFQVDGARDAEVDASVAWNAHVGGFVTGMLLAVLAMAVRPERFVDR